MTRTPPEPAPASPNFLPHQREEMWPPTHDIACNGTQYTTGLQENRVSSLELSSPEAETLSLGRRDLERNMKTRKDLDIHFYTILIIGEGEMQNVFITFE
ncbi:hypothetical protein AVEN_127785-1 [Araneus ventricosus]|uniref:Uncharacterized protein n=1 Tax=Araneus ventricosus TaxID=182803 RepID=A0A4Y2DRU0_ARAVE|nr:hypothetical protein AVEN_127785-1 [Araneus ventricosus]